jgi:hypothetical protein
MHVLGPQVSAALFTDRDKADEAWGLLTNAGIPAAIITDPGMLGKYELSVMVERENLERAQKLLAPLVTTND